MNHYFRVGDFVEVANPPWRARQRGRVVSVHFSRGKNGKPALQVVTIAMADKKIWEHYSFSHESLVLVSRKALK